MIRKRRLDAISDDLGDLLEAHDAGTDLSEFEEYRDRPVAFIREVLGEKPWSGQEEIAEAVHKSPLTVVRSANAVGKDWLSARLALWWVYARQGLVLLTGPTERQVVEVVMGEVARGFGSAPELPGELYRTALRLGREEQAGVLAFTSTEASRLTGFHAPRVMAVVTEAQGVEEFAWEGLLACTTGREDRVLAAGNPLTPDGRFYRASQPESDWTAIQIPASEHPNLQTGETVIPGGPSPEFADRIASEFGRNSGVYRARVLAEFPEQSEEGLFRRGMLEAAVRRWRLAKEGRFAVGFEEEEPVIAVDPARYGPDRTVVAVRRGPVLKRFESWHGADTAETAERVAQVAAEAGCQRGYGESGYRGRGLLVVDTVGLGAGVYDALQDDWRVREFKGSRSPSGRSAEKRFRNARSEAYWTLRARLEEGDIALPDSEELIRELLAVRWSPDAQGRVKLEAKSELKSRLGRSPDRGDAAIMAFSVEAARKERRIWRFTSTG